jgi:hypothetical protein
MTTAITTIPEVSPAVAMIQAAIDKGMAPEQLREFLAARREWDADEARKAYFHAIAEFQRRAPIIEKGDDAHGKKYAAMDRIWREIRPIVTDLGLSVTWQVCELRDNSICHLEGQIAHKAGHCVFIVQDIPLPELIRGQNAAQQMGSATMYAKRYALCSALGIVTGDDDDAHVAGTAFVTREQVEVLSDLLRKCPEGTLEALCGWAECESLAEIPAAKFPTALKTLKGKAQP